MKKIFLRFNAFLKGFILVLRPHLLFGWLQKPLLLMSNTLALSKWISSQNNNGILNDFYTPTRDYDKRHKLYESVIGKYGIDKEAIQYLEFGVSQAHSFKWWLTKNQNPNSTFYGFDTFEGLPENWGTFSKGAMAAAMPVLQDERAHFIKGLFQDTLPGFLQKNKIEEGRRVIHLDADLFSSTLYALTSLSPYLKKGDILFFDEFNVPNHEFFALKIFEESYYVKYKLIGAVNNYYQLALIVE